MFTCCLFALFICLFTFPLWWFSGFIPVFHAGVGVLEVRLGEVSLSGPPHRHTDVSRDMLEQSFCSTEASWRVLGVFAGFLRFFRQRYVRSRHVQ